MLELNACPLNIVAQLWVETLNRGEYGWICRPPITFYPPKLSNELVLYDSGRRP